MDSSAGGSVPLFYGGIMPVVTIKEQDLWISIKTALSIREYDIVMLRFQGYKFKEIAKKYNISRWTVGRQWKKIRKKVEKLAT